MADGNEQLIEEVRQYTPRWLTVMLANALDVDAPDLISAERRDPMWYHLVEFFNEAQLRVARIACRVVGHRPEGGVYEAMYCDRCWRVL